MSARLIVLLVEILKSNAVMVFGSTTAIQQRQRFPAPFSRLASLAAAMMQAHTAFHVLGDDNTLLVDDDRQR